MYMNDKMDNSAEYRSEDKKYDSADEAADTDSSNCGSATSQENSSILKSEVMTIEDNKDNEKTATSAISETLKEDETTFSQQPKFPEYVHAEPETETNEYHTERETQASALHNDQKAENGQEETLHGSADDITIKVKQLDGTSFEIHGLSLNSSVNDLKSKIKEKTNILEGNQRIIYHGKVLHSGSLRNYKMKDRTFVHLVHRDPSRTPVPPSNTGGREQEDDRGYVNTPENAANSLSLLLSSALRNSNRSNAAQTSRGQVHPLRPVDFNVEHIWQGLRTVNCMLDSFDELQEYPQLEESDSVCDFVVNDLDESDGSRSEKNSETKEEPSEVIPSIRRFQCGQWIDVLDTVNQWLEATVMHVSHDGMKILVHYNAWGERWDEVLDVRSERIAPFRTKTKNRRNCQNLSGTPAAWVKAAPRIGSGALEDIMPEALSAFERVMPLLKDASENNENDERRLERLLYLAPILDRMGRMLGDVASKLAQRPDLKPKKRIINMWPFSGLSQSILPFNLYTSKRLEDYSERNKLMEERGLDSDFLQLMNPSQDNSSRNGNLDIHIHAIVSPVQISNENEGSATTGSDSVGPSSS